MGLRGSGKGARMDERLSFRGGIVPRYDATGTTNLTTAADRHRRTPIGRVLAALDAAHCTARERPPKRDGVASVWRAPCPVCSTSRGRPPLELTELDGGRVLVRCHRCHGGLNAGAEHERTTAGILAALGLTLADLSGGASGAACASDVRAWLTDWAAMVAAYPWPVRRRVSVLRVAAAFVSFSRHAGGDPFPVSWRRLGFRALRGMTATRGAVALLTDAGFVDRLSVGRFARRDGGDVVAVPSTWRLTWPAENGHNRHHATYDGERTLDPYLLRKHGSAMSILGDGRDALSWWTRVGGDVDRVLGGASYRDTLAAVLDAWQTTDTAGTWTVADVMSRRGGTRRTVQRHLDRLVGLGVVRVVCAGGRGRGKAARYAVWAPGLVGFVERTRGAEHYAAERASDDAAARLSAFVAETWRRGNLDALRRGVVDAVPVDPVRLVVVDDAEHRPEKRASVAQGGASVGAAVARSAAECEAMQPVGPVVPELVTGTGP